MNYITIKEPGPPDVLEMTKGDAPTPQKKEVLINVFAAGLNRPDLLQRQGLYPPPPGASPILGLEVSGEIVSLGQGASSWKIGDKVCALTNGGGYAEYVNVPENQCLPVPEGLSMVEAAALPETCFTVWTNVFDRAKLTPDEILLVHGGAGGIGTTAIQMAHALGSSVFTTAGSDEKCDVCRKLGAKLAINYKREDFVEVIQAETNKNGVNVILDMVGGDYLSKNINIAAMDGRIVNIAYLKGAKAEVNFMPVMLKRLILTGSTLRPLPYEAKETIAAALRKNVWPHIAAGKIKPLIHKVFSLEDAARAHELMESSAHIGKIMLQVG